MIWLFPLAILSGVLGRMGGAGKSGQWYDRLLDTKWRDIGCSIIFVLCAILLFGWSPSFWWAYGLVFLLHWGAFSTYWDEMWGYDNLWFSGFMVGLAGTPLLFIDHSLWGFLLGRTIVLTVVWGCLNKYLPQKGIWIWRRDIVEEFSRYFVSL